jgi:hypothetical protein
MGSSPPALPVAPVAPMPLPDALPIDEPESVAEDCRDSVVFACALCMDVSLALAVVADALPADVDCSTLLVPCAALMSWLLMLRPLLHALMTRAAPSATAVSAPAVRDAFISDLRDVTGKFPHHGYRNDHAACVSTVSVPAVGRLKYTDGAERPCGPALRWQ